MDIIELQKKICDIYGISFDDFCKVKSNDRLKREVLGLFVYVAHHHYNISASKIAKTINTGVRNVFLKYAKYKFLVENDKYTQDKYNEILSHINLVLPH